MCVVPKTIVSLKQLLSLLGIVALWETSNEVQKLPKLLHKKSSVLMCENGDNYYIGHCIR